MLVSFAEWERVAKMPSFADLLLSFPGNPADIPRLRRNPMRPMREALYVSTITHRDRRDG